MRLWLALLGVAALSLTACNSTTRLSSASNKREFGRTGDALTATTQLPGDGTGAVSATGARAAVGGAAGHSAAGRAASGTVATTKAPIEIGILLTGTSNAASFGVSAGNSLSETDVDNAVVDALDKQGGIAGHRIVPVYASTDTGSTSWSADYAAACSTFTEDHHVVAVLGYSFNHDEGFERCLAGKRIPHLSTAVNVPDAKVLAQYPLLEELSTPRIERRSQLKIDGGLATGVVTRASRIGIVTDSCPGTQRAWTDVTRPYLAAKGLSVASEFDIGCPDGASDAGSAAGQVPALILQFKAARVDVISVFGVSEGPAILLISSAAQAQNWHPTYLVSSLADTSILADQIVKGQVAQIVGYGWMPVLDVKPGQWPALPAAAQRCVALLQTRNVKPVAAADFAYAFNICEAFFLYQNAVTATGGAIDGAAVARAIQGLGATYSGALSLEGRLSFAPGRPDAPALARHFAWSDGCSCFTYRTYSAPIG